MEVKMSNGFSFLRMKYICPSSVDGDLSLGWGISDAIQSLTPEQRLICADYAASYLLQHDPLSPHVVAKIFPSWIHDFINHHPCTKEEAGKFAAQIESMIQGWQNAGKQIS